MLLPLTPMSALTGQFPSSFNYVIGAFLWNLARIGITVPSPSNTEFRTMERAYTKAT